MGRFSSDAQVFSDAHFLLFLLSFLCTSSGLGVSCHRTPQLDQLLWSFCWVNQVSTISGQGLVDIEKEKKKLNFQSF